jgi:hypothetical protein
MRRYLLIAVALGVCAWAVADVRVFVTSSAAGYGLDLLGPQGDGTGIDPEHEDWPIDPFRPTYSSVDYYGDDYAYDYYYAYYRVGAYPPIDATSGTVDDPILIDVSAGQWAYIWFQYRNEPRYMGIRAIFEAREAGTETPAQGLQFTYYLQNNKGEYADPQFKRWDNTATPPEYPEWRSNPQTLDNITAYGLPNWPYDEPWNMFHRQGGTGLNPTGVGLLAAITGQPGDTVYEYRMTNWDYPDGSVPAQGEHAFFKFVPEPAGLAMLVVCAALCRRRR